MCVSQKTTCWNLFFFPLSCVEPKDWTLVVRLGGKCPYSWAVSSPPLGFEVSVDVVLHENYLSRHLCEADSSVGHHTGRSWSWRFPVKFLISSTLLQLFLVFEYLLFPSFTPGYWKFIKMTSYSQWIMNIPVRSSELSHPVTDLIHMASHLYCGLLRISLCPNHISLVTLFRGSSSVDWQINFILIFLRFIFYFCFCMSLCHMCVEPVEARRRHWISWNWNSRLLWTAWGGAARVTSAPNCWAISPAFYIFPICEFAFLVPVLFWLSFLEIKKGDFLGTKPWRTWCSWALVISSAGLVSSVSQFPRFSSLWSEADFSGQIAVGFKC